MPPTPRPIPRPKVVPSTKPTKTERLAALLADIRSRAKLDTWNEFIREAQVPAAIFPAMMSQRAELMPKATALTADEAQILYNLIAVLMETNAALREHTEHTALLVCEWIDSFKGLHTLASHIASFGAMKQINDAEGSPLDDED